jgi:hypothetical protein
VGTLAENTSGRSLEWHLKIREASMKYFIVPAKTVGWYEYEPEVWPAIVPPRITVVSSEARNTGLVDEHGAAIMKSPERLGFLK